MNIDLTRRMIKIHFLFLFISLISHQFVYSQILNKDEELSTLNWNPQEVSLRGQQKSSPDMVNYNRFTSKDILLFLGAGYGSQGFLNFNFNFAKVYTSETVNIIPPVGVGMEYSLSSFFSLGSEFTYFKFNSEELSEAPLSLFLFKFRYVFHHSFSRLNLYFGGSIGGYALNTIATVKEIPNLFGPSSIGGLTYSIFTGFRIFFLDSFFIYAETAIPFPLAMAGFGLKL